jgi:hypothetical protein
VHLEVVDEAQTSRQKETDMMLSSLKRFTVIAGMTCAITGAGPVALASAATPPSIPTISLPSLPLPSQPFPGQSCSTNQGLFPGFINLGPTGPLGPLGPGGPLGGNGKNLPCGADVFNLGPGGPLGPHGPLGGPAGN